MIITYAVPPVIVLVTLTSPVSGSVYVVSTSCGGSNGTPSLVRIPLKQRIQQHALPQN